MVTDITHLIKNYTDWLFQKITIREINNFTELTLPFLDRNNDYIQIYLKEIENNQFLLTDAGYTISDLKMSGFSIESEKRKKLLLESTKGQGIDFTDANELQVTTSSIDFPQKLNDLIQAIQEVNDLSNLAISNASHPFINDIKTWLREKNVRFSPNVGIRGKNGLTFNFKIVIPGSTDVPEKFIESFNQINQGNVESTAYKWNQIKEMREGTPKLYILYNKYTSLEKVQDICSAEEMILIPTTNLPTYEEEITA